MLEERKRSGHEEKSLCVATHSIPTNPQYTDRRRREKNSSIHQVTRQATGDKWLQCLFDRSFLQWFMTWNAFLSPAGDRGERKTTRVKSEEGGGGKGNQRIAKRGERGQENNIQDGYVCVQHTLTHPCSTSISLVRDREKRPERWMCQTWRDVDMKRRRGKTLLRVMLMKALFLSHSLTHTFRCSTCSFTTSVINFSAVKAQILSPVWESVFDFVMWVFSCDHFTQTASNFLNFLPLFAPLSPW